MRILVVAATRFEIAPLLTECDARPDITGRVSEYTFASHHLDVLQAGVGMVSTAVWCARQLALARYDLSLNLGVCGSFDPALPLASTVHVVSEAMPELGAEDGEAFISMQQLQLIREDEAPFSDGRLVNAHPPRSAVLASLPQVHGITVNTVHGNERTIAAVVERCRPQVESMEGAAFMHACLTADVPFAEVRAISNFVERRNRNAWKMNDAVASLNETARRLLESL
ncbi:MAG: futalosine hydrolase [Acidobacteriaceae bacterium]|nr:futalosine hydrolase [Acidobacteriaceae bacterium]